MNMIYNFQLIIGINYEIFKHQAKQKEVLPI